MFYTISYYNSMKSILSTYSNEDKSYRVDGKKISDFNTKGSGNKKLDAIQISFGKGEGSFNDFNKHDLSEEYEEGIPTKGFENPFDKNTLNSNNQDKEFASELLMEDSPVAKSTDKKTNKGRKIDVGQENRRNIKHPDNRPKTNILNNDDADNVTQAMSMFYEANKEELNEAKKMLQKIKGNKFGRELSKGKVALSVQNINKKAPFKNNVSRPAPVKKSDEINGCLKPGERIITVKMIGIEPLGDYKVTENTTFAQLRSIVTTNTGISNWSFQDLDSKRSINNSNEEKKMVLAPGGYVIISAVGLETLVADAALHGSLTLGMSKDGSCSFKVLWYDCQFRINRPVWLKFEPGRISVTGVGGSFKLFDLASVRVPLIFAGVKGSERAFQFMKSRNSNRASKFYATNIEQKKVIGIYFCFVWRPHAIRKGWIREQDIVHDDVSEEDDPRKFANILRRHMLEVDTIIRDIETNMDSRSVRKYIRLFAQMFTGGYSLKDADKSGREDLSMKNIRNRLLEWREGSKKHAKESELDPYSQIDDYEEPDSINDPYNSYFNRDGVSINSPFSDVTNLIEPLSKFPNGAKGMPPPPLLPPSMIQIPAICPINFEGISATDITDTIWAEISKKKLCPEEAQSLKYELQIIFGRDSRDIAQFAKPVEEREGILDSVRVRNVEVLLFMEEIKSYSIDELIELVGRFDPILFNYQVLDRLVRQVSTEDGKGMVFLPTKKEVELLDAYNIKLKSDPNLPPLRLGENLFYLLSKRIPDYTYRFEFGYLMTKFDEESSSLFSSLKVIRDAENSIRKSTKFSEALALIMEILNTLMPRYGFTRGFKISSFCQSIDRVTGVVANPLYGKEDRSKNIPDTEDPISKAEKIALKFRKKKNTLESEFWAIRLPEYMTMYLSRFRSCHGFWDELADVCGEAIKIDQVFLDTQTSEWTSQFEKIKVWYQNEAHFSKDDNFPSAIDSFLKKESKIKELRSDVLDCRNLTENLWRWLGERMESEPQLIFKYILDFSLLFRDNWNNLNAVWEQNRTKVLRRVLKLIPYKKSKANKSTPRLPSSEKGDSQETVGVSKINNLSGDEKILNEVSNSKSMPLENDNDQFDDIIDDVGFEVPDVKVSEKVGNYETRNKTSDIISAHKIHNKSVDESERNTYNDSYDNLPTSKVDNHFQDKVRANNEDPSEKLKGDEHKVKAKRKSERKNYTTETTHNTKKHLR